MKCCKLWSQKSWSFSRIWRQYLEYKSSFISCKGPHHFAFKHYNYRKKVSLAAGGGWGGAVIPALRPPPPMGWQSITAITIDFLGKIKACTGYDYTVSSYFEMLQKKTCGKLVVCLGNLCIYPIPFTPPPSPIGCSRPLPMYSSNHRL